MMSNYTGFLCSITVGYVLMIGTNFKWITIFATKSSCRSNRLVNMKVDNYIITLKPIVFKPLLHVCSKREH